MIQQLFSAAGCNFSDKSWLTSQLRPYLPKKTDKVHFRTSCSCQGTKFNKISKRESPKMCITCYPR